MNAKPRLPLTRRAIAGAGMLTLGISMTAPAPSDLDPVPARQQESVVLLHGWWSNPLAMLRLEWSLRGAGYEVANIAYPSIRIPLDEIARDRLPRALQRRVSLSTARVHFVTHSIGGLLLREFLAHHQVENLGRIVMLGPPNHGSELADGPHLAVTRWIAGPNARFLNTTNDRRTTCPLPATEIGIIAGDHTWLPASPKLPRPNDGRVSVKSTRLAGMADQVVVPVPHSLLPWDGRVLKLVRTFLDTGRFVPSE